jgi:hypothetical protein
MIEGISETRAFYSGYFYNDLRKLFESGKVPVWKEEEIMKKKFEARKEKTQPRYNSYGKLIGYNYIGQNVNFMA